MKAYLAWDRKAIENYQTIVFAENAREAKKIAFTCEICENADYIQVRVRRLKDADKFYKGNPEIDWWDDETRLSLVKNLSWSCEYTSHECESCVARKYCGHWED